MGISTPRCNLESASPTNPTNLSSGSGPLLQNLPFDLVLANSRFSSRWERWTYHPRTATSPSDLQTPRRLIFPKIYLKRKRDDIVKWQVVSHVSQFLTAPVPELVATTNRTLKAETGSCDAIEGCLAVCALNSIERRRMRKS